MTSATITSKHQITVPSPVRKQLGLRQGDRILFTPDKNGGFALRRAGGTDSDGYARKFLRSGKPAAVTDKSQASRRAAAAAYVRRNG